MKYGDRVLLKEYKNGNKLWGIVSHCPKCQDTGKVIWSYADHVCFDCNGNGWYYSKERELTPENLAKLEAKREQERKAVEEERAKRKAERDAEKARKEAERLAEIERNRGQFIGNVGDKIQMEVTLDKTFDFERRCFNAPWKKEMITGYVFKTDDGNTLVWKTTGSLHRKVYCERGHFRDNEKDGWYDFEHPEVGTRLTISASIAGHEEYNNVNQTVLQRVKWIFK